MVGTDPRKIWRMIFTAGTAVVVAVAVFGVPLRSVLLVGLFLLCPLTMFGMHGSGHVHEEGTARADGDRRAHGEDAS